MNTSLEVVWGTKLFLEARASHSLLACNCQRIGLLFKPTREAKCWNSRSGETLSSRCFALRVAIKIRKRSTRTLFAATAVGW